MAATLKAEVRNGRLVLDEPTTLPDGTVIVLAEVFPDPLAAMSADERLQLDRSIDRGLADARDGKVQNVDELLASL
ncbi:MAG: hypothetical protein GXP55_17195 [Deltaproteobacteria bacterium]|nr:hypothetical protein [Deltaproteobacteria bacterium]